MAEEQLSEYDLIIKLVHGRIVHQGSRKGNE
jgi:hypothetical protein